MFSNTIKKNSYNILFLSKIVQSIKPHLLLWYPNYVSHVFTTTRNNCPMTGTYLLEVYSFSNKHKPLRKQTFAFVFMVPHTHTQYRNGMKRLRRFLISTQSYYNLILKCSLTTCLPLSIYQTTASHSDRINFSFVFVLLFLDHSLFWKSLIILFNNYVVKSHMTELA